MIIKPPINFNKKFFDPYDRSNKQRCSEFFIPDGKFYNWYEEEGILKSGKDALNSTCTNIAGYDGTDLLKFCPCCKQVKSSIYFGYEGRYNGSRDQSYCNNCRRY